MKLLVIFTALLIACNSSTKSFPIGGYEYPKLEQNSDTGFIYYQLKDSFSKEDSFKISFLGKHFLKIFNEPNLSIRPQNQVIFRLIYESWYRHTIIILTKNRITVKKVKKGYSYPFENDSSWNGDKEFYAGIEDFEYQSEDIPISENTFQTLIKLINQSDFWQLPFEVSCNNVPTDADQITLEANTKNRYKVVTWLSCPGDTSALNLACQKIINAAGLGKEIKLIWDGSVIASDSIIVQ